MSSAAEDAVERVPISVVAGNWKLEGAVGLFKAEKVGVKRWFYDLQETCCAKKHKVPDSVAEAFGLAEELFLGRGSADILDESHAHARC